MNVDVGSMASSHKGVILYVLVVNGIYDEQMVKKKNSKFEYCLIIKSILKKV